MKRAARLRRSAASHFLRHRARTGGAPRGDVQHVGGCSRTRCRDDGGTRWLLAMTDGAAPSRHAILLHHFACPASEALAAPR